MAQFDRPPVIDLTEMASAEGLLCPDAAQQASEVALRAIAGRLAAPARRELDIGRQARAQRR